MARASARVLMRLAMQQQQQRAAPPPPPRTSQAPASTAPQARPERVPKQGRGGRPAGPPISGKLSLKPDTAIPPQVAQRIGPSRPGQGSSPKSQPVRPKQRKHDGPHPIERLAGLYPAVFNVHAPKPLALGVNWQGAQALGIHPRLVEGALARWTDRVNYLAALAAPGSRRFNLDGSDAGEVDAEHRQHAADKLAAKMAVTLRTREPEVTDG
jgi:RNA chaperone ProQ/FINO-like protein